jgi:hypothetical protein
MSPFPSSPSVLSTSTLQREDVVVDAGSTRSGSSSGGGGGNNGGISNKAIELLSLIMGKCSNFSK